ncbi:MAG: hypothetical protein RLZZ325_414, partial [Pseudomonadota bacterium]
INSWGIHWHNDLANSRMRRSVIACSTDEVAIVRNFTKTCPYFLTVDDPFIAIKLGKRFQRSKVTACVWFAHTNAPSGFSGEHVGQECVLLFCSSVCNERWTHLSIGKPRSITKPRPCKSSCNCPPINELRF